MNGLALFLISYLICFFSVLQASPTQPICLNMIVKNESAVICRCLASVKHLIDYWVIVDTGSTDGTQELIKEYLKYIPGELHERPWKNFAANRNEALVLAQGRGEYILFIDADDRLVFDADFCMPHLSHDLYYLWHNCGGCTFINHHFVKSGLPWKWVGVVHELLECDQKFSSAILNKVVYQMENDGASHHDPKKFLKYIGLLEQSLREDPDNRRDLNSLARSYKGAGMYQEALDTYERLLNLGDHNEETFRAWIEVGQIQEQLGYSLDSSVASFLRARRLFPLRPEPVYYLARLYNRAHLFELAYACLKGNQRLDQSSCKSFVFNEDWTRRYGLLFELSICSYYVGQYREAIESCEALLLLQEVPMTLRPVIEQNRACALSKFVKSPTT